MHARIGSSQVPVSYYLVVPGELKKIKGKKSKISAVLIINFFYLGKLEWLERFNAPTIDRRESSEARSALFENKLEKQENIS